MWTVTFGFCITFASSKVMLFPSTEHSASIISWLAVRHVGSLILSVQHRKNELGKTEKERAVPGEITAPPQSLFSSISSLSIWLIKADLLTVFCSIHQPQTSSSIDIFGLTFLVIISSHKSILYLSSFVFPPQSGQTPSFVQPRKPQVHASIIPAPPASSREIFPGNSPAVPPGPSGEPFVIYENRKPIPAVATERLNRSIRFFVGGVMTTVKDIFDIVGYDVVIQCFLHHSYHLRLFYNLKLIFI